MVNTHIYPFHLAGSQVRQALALAGHAISRECFQATAAALADFQLRGAEAADVARDLPYGSDPRHRFDWFRPHEPSNPENPVVVLFVHGGGFVGGSKQEASTPLYDNVGLWAAANGYYAATMTYRLAPQHPWPAGGDDVHAAAVAVAAHAKVTLGASPHVYLMGHSAGAVHVATAITRQQPPAEVAGAILVSGFYDNTVGRPNAAYFGEQPDLFPAQSSLSGLCALDLPLLVVVAENDPASMHRHAAAVLKGRTDNEKPLPQCAVLDGNNHYSSMFLLNSGVDSLGPRLCEFINRQDASNVPSNQ